MSPTRPILGVARPMRRQAVPQRRQIGAPDMRQHQVLRMGDADLAIAVGIGQIGDRLHLRRRGIAGNAAVGLQREGDDGIAGLAMGVRHCCASRARRPSPRARLATISGGKGSAGAKAGRRELRLDALDLGGRQGQRAVLDPGPFLLDRLGEFGRAHGGDQDLDPRLVEIVAPAEQIVDAQHRLEIGEQMLLRQELAHGDADGGRAPLPAARRSPRSRSRRPRSYACAGRCHGPSPPRGHGARR